MNSSRKTSSSRGAPEKDPAAVSIDFDHLSRLCLKYWKWLAGAIVGGAFIGLIVALVQTPVYEAKSSIVIKAKDSDLPNVGDVGPQARTMDELNTLVQFLQRRDLMVQVVKDEHLNENPDFLPPGTTAPISEETATDMLMGGVSIRNRPLSWYIDIKVDHSSPKMAKFLADRIAQESIVQEFEQSSDNASVLSDYLQKEVTRLQDKVADSERAVQEYQAAHPNDGQISTDSPSNIVIQQLEDLNKQYIDAQAKVALLKERYGDLHPLLIQAEKDRDELASELAQAQAKNVDVSTQSIGYEALKTEAESTKAQLANMRKALADADVTAHVNNADISVAEEAELPLAPVRPSKTKSVAVGGFVGLLGGLCFILGIYFIDGSIRTVTQAENTLGVPVIAAVPILTASEGKSVLPTFSDPQSFVAEAFRGLRASLLLHDRENPLKTILVCSAIPGEGKSFCTANLAVAFAQAGLKTLLIDADLRLPTIHTYFNLPPSQQNCGFTDVLSGQATLAKAAIRSPIPTLDLLLTSIPADSPAELLSGIRLPLFLDEAAAIYDRVVIDSAPLKAVSDTMLIMPKADGILLVVRAAQTPASESKGALQKINSSKMKPLGLILNYLAPHTLKSYAYGYSYGQKPKEKNAK